MATVLREHTYPSNQMAAGRNTTVVAQSTPATPAATFYTTKVQEILNAINSLSVEDIVGERSEIRTDRLSAITSAVSLKNRTLTDLYYTSHHYTRHGELVRAQQAERQNALIRARQGRIQWLKDHLQVGDFVECGYGAYRQRCIVAITPTLIDTLVGDPISGKITGRTMRQATYEEIQRVWDRESVAFRSLPDVTGISDPTS